MGPWGGTERCGGPICTACSTTTGAVASGLKVWDGVSPRGLLCALRMRSTIAWPMPWASLETAVGWPVLEAFLFGPG